MSFNDQTRNSFYANKKEPRVRTRFPLAERRGVLPLEKGKANEVCEGIVVPDEGANLAIGTIVPRNPLPRFCGKKKARANKFCACFFSLGGTVACQIELLISKRHCFAVVKKKLR